MQYTQAGNAFAYFALFSWPIVVIFLFRKLPRSEALIWSILGGYLLLPFGVGVKIKMVPTFDKMMIPAISAALLCLIERTNHRPPLYSPRRSNRAFRVGAAVNPETAKSINSTGASNHIWRRESRQVRSTPNTVTKMQRRSKGVLLIDLLIALFILSPFITVLQNPEPVQAGPRILPGLHIYDSFSMISHRLIWLIPFLLGRSYLAAPRDQALLLRTLGISGLIYSLPALFEVRMSPQLSRWIYGFLAQPFAQTIRDGGWRPVVFLQHGLWLAIFFAMTALAAISTWRYEGANGLKTRWLLAGIYLTAVLVLCHSLGALAILVILAPLALLATVRIEMILATAVTLSILIYPALRGSGLMPVDTIYNFTKSWISVNRAGSFYFRLQNEDILLAKAEKKPIVGWGEWGRSRVYDKSGNDISVTDGYWVIILGTSGWLGYIAVFGLYTSPILLLSLRRRRLDPSIATSGLCLVLAANLIDMIPNSTMSPLTWLIAGALAGRYGYGAEKPKGAAAESTRSRFRERDGRPSSLRRALRPSASLMTK